MGLPDIRRVYHWGLPSNLEEYVQETGRAGHDGELAKAILFQGTGGKHSNEAMKNYEANNCQCRRRLLFKGFLMFCVDDYRVTSHRCCDICEQCKQ